MDVGDEKAVVVTYRRVSHSGKKHKHMPPMIYIPKELKEQYLKIHEARYSADGYVMIVANKKNGMMLVVPPWMKERIEKIGIENVGKLLLEGEGDG